MKIRKINITNFIMFTLIFSIYSLCFAAIIKAFNLWSDEIISGLLGFLGAIFGGAVTLASVLLTLDNQKRKEFLDSYPKKRKNADDVDIEIMDLYRGLKKCNEDKEYRANLGYLLQDGIKKQDETLEKAAEVNNDIYTQTREFYFCLSRLVHNFSMDASLSFKDKIEKENINKMYFVTCKIGSYVQMLENKYKELSKI
jgi:hypothetical protein